MHDAGIVSVLSIVYLSSVTIVYCGQTVQDSYQSSRFLQLLENENRMHCLNDVGVCTHFCVCCLQECSSFLAGNEVRSRCRNSKLDIRGIFGSVCRHEFPFLFMDMKHGER